MKHAAGGGALRHARVETALGPLALAATDLGLCFVDLRPRPGRGRLAAWARRFAPDLELREDAAFLADACRQLVEYGAGRRRVFDLPLDLCGTDFQRAVWNELLGIEFGRTRTYGELAARLGRPGAARAVGGAAGANPVPLIVPCHRLLAGRGLGGFSGGLQRKRVLLELEGHAGAPTLFPTEPA